MIKISILLKLCVMLIVAITMGVLSFAQNKTDSSVKGNNNFNQNIDYSRPGQYHQLLADLAGEWNFKGKHFSGNPNPDSNKAVVEFGGDLMRKPFANGRFFLVEWTGGRMQIPIQDGKMIEDNVRTLETEGYDNVKRKFVTTFINNHIGSGINYSEGSYDPATKTIFYETEIEQVPGKKIKVYQQFIIHNKDHYTLEYYRERNGRKYKATELNCTRATERKGFPIPGEFHKMLARSNGTWIGEATLQFSSDAPPVNTGTTSILVNKMAMSGLYQVSEIKGNIAPGMGIPWTGLRITGYDDKRKLFTRAMIGDGDAAGGVAMEGYWDADTQSITMPFKKFNSSTGKERNLKEVYRIIDENTEILEIYATDPKTNKEFKMLNVKWTRKY